LSQEEIQTLSTHADSLISI